MIPVTFAGHALPSSPLLFKAARDRSRKVRHFTEMYDYHDCFYKNMYKFEVQLN